MSLTTLLAFWKKKETSAPERIIPLPSMPSPRTETPRSTSQEAVSRAREDLKVLRLERQILGSAVTTIYESQTKGQISQAERDRLLEKYKVDLKRLEKAIEENQRVVDLFDLESARDNLIRDFNARMAEIDARLRDMKSGTSSTSVAKQAQDLKPDPAEDRNKSQGQGDEPAQKQANETKPKEDDPEITDAEKRVNQIREEILRAMDRLEQIEAEG